MRCPRIQPVLYVAFILALCVSYWSSLSWAKDGKVLPPASSSSNKLQGTEPNKTIVTKIRHLSSEN
ncbi:MAG: hypothetical protein ACE5E2_06920, partial [Candidatus Binatia bacterium]